MPVADCTVISVVPGGKSAVVTGVTAIPPVPTLPVTCVPSAIPDDADNGAPISGAPPDVTVNGITSSPESTVNAGLITPELP
jgi:hypothetical protein